jgi:hypothetical protein
MRGTPMYGMRGTRVLSKTDTRRIQYVCAHARAHACAVDPAVLHRRRPLPEQKCILCATGKEPPPEPGAAGGSSVPLSFANDGSFLQQFQKTQKPTSVFGSVCMCMSKGLPFCQCK